MSTELPLASQLVTVFNWFDKTMLERMAELGWPALSRNQSMVMAHLTESGIRASSIARRQKVSRQAIHQTVNELIKLKLITTIDDPLNSSAKLLVATKLGKSCIKDARKMFGQLEVELSRSIGKAKMQELKAILSESQTFVRNYYEVQSDPVES